MTEIVVYTDGACSGNPGPGGWGTLIIENKERVVELGGGHPSTTNNRMELEAARVALDFVLSNFGVCSCKILTDSHYLMKGITTHIHSWKKNSWKKSDSGEVLNQDLWKALDELAIQFKEKLAWDYVPAHSGIAGNERVNDIAQAFSLGKKPTLFQGNYSHYSHQIEKELVLCPEESSFREIPMLSYPHYLSEVEGVFARHGSWPECEERVKGVSGALYKKVKNLEEEKQVVSEWQKKRKKA